MNATAERCLGYLMPGRICLPVYPSPHHGSRACLRSCCLQLEHGRFLPPYDGGAYISPFDFAVAGLRGQPFLNLARTRLSDEPLLGACRWALSTPNVMTTVLRLTDVPPDLLYVGQTPAATDTVPRSLRSVLPDVPAARTPALGKRTRLAFATPTRWAVCYHTAMNGRENFFPPRRLLVWALRACLPAVRFTASPTADSRHAQTYWFAARFAGLHLFLH